MTLAYLQLTPEDVETERRQLVDAGRDVTDLEAEFDALAASDAETAASDDWQDRALALFDRAGELPPRSEYEYDEPNDLAAIRAARPDGPRSFGLDGPIDEADGTIDEADATAAGAPELEDRLAGAWVGRCAGCLLGKPVEAWTGREIRSFLCELGRYPLEGYLRSDVPAGVAEKYPMNESGGFVNEIERMPRDDDIDFAIVALDVLESEGVGLTTADVARRWLEGFPIARLYTAERVAYRNYCDGLSAPATATTKNPYREFIGAQIRADCYGWIRPGQPERAAELAWRDARLSHVGNGIYGAMWVAAVLAAAPVVGSVPDLLAVGLSEIPVRSRFVTAIEDVLGWYDRGIGYDDAVALVGERWDEDTLYGKFHVVPNAQLVAVALLWSEGFGDAICKAVQAGFDTDCNGATVGSIVGLRRGRERIPDRWASPLADRIETALSGYGRPSITALAGRTATVTVSGSDR